MKKFQNLVQISLILVMLSLTKVNAATITSAATGNWSNGATWVGGIAPVAGDDVIIATGHTVTLTAAVDITTGNLTVSGTLSMAGFDLTAGSLSGTGGINTTAGTTPLLTVGSNGSNTVYQGIMSPATGARFTKVGSGTLTFAINSTHTWTGTTTIAAGTLKLGSLTRIADASPLVINSGATFDMAGFSETVGSLSGAGTVTNSGTTGATLTVGGNSSSTTFSGVIQNGSGLVSLTKSGAGTMVISGSNTYTGSTTLSGGTLQLGASNVLPDATTLILNGSVTFSTGASTGFSETVGNLRLSDASNISTIALGSGVHTLTFANSNAETWVSTGQIAITGWSGAVSGNGTAGSIVFGAPGLTLAQAAQIGFTGFPGAAQLLILNALQAELVPAPSTNYTWNASTGTADWQNANSWTPARTTPAATDILIFNNGGTSIAGNVPVQTIAQLLLSNNTSLTLQAAATGNTLSLQGDAGNDLVVAAGSTLTIGGGSNAIVLAFSASTHAALDGTVNISSDNIGNTFSTTNATAILSGTLNMAATLLNNLTMAGNAQLNFNRTGDYTYSGIITGATGNTASITKNGSGTLTTTGTNTAQGTITFASGIWLTSSLSASCTVVVNSGASWGLAGTANFHLVGSLSGLGTVFN